MLFIFSGLTGLLTEQIFEKILGTLLGASTPAAAIVLSVYFAGISLGAVAYSRWIAPRSSNPLRIYAWLELGIGLWSLILFFFFDSLVSIFAPLLALGANHLYLLMLLRLLVAAFWILPPTFLMGASLPAVVDFLRRIRLANPSRAVAFFYTFNLLGALAGAIAGPYLLFPFFGLDKTLFTCFILDSTVFACASGLSKNIEGSVAAPVRTSIAQIISPGQMILLVGVAALSGFLFFALEVVWIHLISAVLGNSIYSFCIMLGIVLAGLCIGGFVAATIFAGRKYSNASFPGFLMILGALTLSILQPGWQNVPHNFTVWGGSLETFWQGQVLQWIQACLILLLPSSILGIVFPILFRLKSFALSRKEDVVGKMVAANSMASIAGSIVTGFLLIPAIGSWATLRLISLLYLLAGTALFLTFAKNKRYVAVIVAVITLISIAYQKPWDPLKLTSGEHVYFKPLKVGPGTKLRFFHEDTYGGITTVVQNELIENGGKKTSLTLLTNGKFQGNDSGERDAQVGFALIPALMTPLQNDGLVIGLGTGQSADVLMKMKFRNIDIVEIAPGIAEAAAKYFPHINGRILEQPGVKLHIEDGRNFLLLSKEKYDLITMEISSVWFAGSTNLYSREFYQLANERLKHEGVFQQWIQIHHIGIAEIGTAIATARSVFPFVSFWLFGDQGILVASQSPQILRAQPLGNLSEAISKLNMAQASVGLVDLLNSRVLAPEDVTQQVEAHIVLWNTDRNRRFEYFTPRFNLDRRPLAEMNRAVLLKSGAHHPFVYDSSTDRSIKETINAFNHSKRP